MLEPAFNQEIELQKIQMVESYFQQAYSSINSSYDNLFIAILAVLLTSYYGIALNLQIRLPLSFGILLIAIGIATLALAISTAILVRLLNFLRKRQRETLNVENYAVLVDGWINDVAKGIKLPQLSEMKEKVIPKSKQTVTGTSRSFLKH